MNKARIFPGMFFAMALFGLCKIAAFGGLASMFVPPAYATELICSCGVDTGNIAADDNDNDAGDDNMIANDNVAGDGVGNDSGDDNVISNDNLANDDIDNIDNMVANEASCTCADGTRGFWSLPSGGQPVVPGMSTVPKAVRELHGK